MSSGSVSNYSDRDHGCGWTKRSYWNDGTIEWRKDRGGGWTSWSDSNGNSGWERDHGNGWIERWDNSGNVVWGRDKGSGYT
ncbi:MAG: hypothetical protein RMJ60_01615, partial [Anaerolineales bacterium]|nr:hypothetical protein [Anaerolineales bacterium]